MAAIDQFANVANKDNPADRWFAITPGADDLAIMPRGLICTATGNITMKDAAGTALALTAVAAGAVLRLRPTKVTAATGTFYGLY
jgi:hypothetical protein